MFEDLGLGVVVAALIAMILALLGILNFFAALATFLFIFGAWCIVSGIRKNRDVYYYVYLGLLIASLATAYFIPIQYSIALALIFIIVLVIISKLKSR